MDRRQLLRSSLLAAPALLYGCARGSTTGGPQASPPPSTERVAPPEPEPTTAEQPPDPATEPASPTPEPEPEPEAEPEPEPAGPVRRIEVLCRDALGLAAATAGARAHTISRVTLHHTAVALGSNAQAPSRLRGHQRFHQDQGWADIAYHYGIDLAGNVYELRDPATAGDTFTDYDPASHLLIVCEGEYDTQQPTDAMLAAVTSLVAYGARTYGLSIDELAGHRDEASTSCPGDGLYTRLPDLRAEAHRILGSERPELRPVCGDEGRARVAAVEAGAA